jgi:hypothetical protein
MKRVAEVFQSLNVGLVPTDETIRAVIRAMPKGEAWRRGRRASGRAVIRPKPTPMTYVGTAASWPHLFARHESEPSMWSAGDDWFFWVVVTDKQLHAFEGRNTSTWKDEPSAGPEAAHFPLDQVAEITFDKGLISQLGIWFKDGSSVELEAGKQNFTPFMEATRPFVRADSTRPRRRGWMPAWASWALAIAFLIGGMAASIGASADARTVSLLNDRGIHTTAKVVGGRVERVGGNRIATLDLEFQDEFGLTAEASRGYCGDPEEKQVGDEIGIVYNPDDTTVVLYEDCHYSATEYVAVTIGIVALILGAFLTLRAWRSSGWKRHRVVGIPLVILGVLFIGTAYSEDCNCREASYTGAAMVIIGGVAQFGRSSTKDASL